MTQFKTIYATHVLAFSCLVLTACQTGTAREEKLVFAPVFFKESDMKHDSRKTYSSDEQWISARRNGRLAGVAFSKLKKDYIFTNDPLSKFNFKVWKVFGKKTIDDVVFGAKHEVHTPLGKIPYVTFNYKDHECIFFDYYYHRHIQDARFQKNLSGFFCETPNTPLDEKVVSEFLHQVGEYRRYDPVAELKVGDASTTSPEANESSGKNNSR